MVTVIHIVKVPADCVWIEQWLAYRIYRDAEGLIVQSSAASTLFAGLHTVVCAQTHFVGRGGRMQLVKSRVVRWSRGVSFCVGVSEARAAASPSE